MPNTVLVPFYNVQEIMKHILNFLTLQKNGLAFIIIVDASVITFTAS